MGKNSAAKRRRRKERKRLERLLWEKKEQEQRDEENGAGGRASSFPAQPLSTSGADEPSSCSPGSSATLNATRVPSLPQHKLVNRPHETVEPAVSSKNEKPSIRSLLSKKKPTGAGEATITSSSRKTAQQSSREVSNDNTEAPRLLLPSSKKRPLAALNFVYPKQQNGTTKAYTFTKLRNDKDNNKQRGEYLRNGAGGRSGARIVVENGDESNLSTEREKKPTKEDETIEDILYGSKKKKRRRKGSEENLEAAAAAAAATAEVNVNHSKPWTPSAAPQPQGKEETAPATLTPHNGSISSSDGIDASSRSSSGANTDGHLSGYSVEDAVRDKWGCRPRSNSTDAELNLPQRGLCDERKVLESHKWKLHPLHSPTGFVNLGNTCFLNSTLQCLAFLPPFCQSLLSLPSAGGSCANIRNNGTKPAQLSQGKRFTVLMRTLFRQIHGKSNGPSAHHPNNNHYRAIAPRELVNAIPSLGTCGSRNGYKFRPGRQEDAHEFLVYLLDAMNDGELREAGINQNASGWRDRLPIPRLDETTFVHRIFGGYFRNQLVCTSCGHRSNTYDPFLDLSLEVSRKSCHSIEQAIKEFTGKETLDSHNRWKCSGCKKKVCATKQLTVFRPPLSLCIQLKRFKFSGGGFLSGGSLGYGHFSGFGGGGGGNYGRKITKPIAFPAQLELPLSDGRSCGYSLTGMVVHVGGSASSGHYTAYVKKPSRNGTDQWFHVDDSYVDIVSERSVLKQKDAYVLFYCRREVKLEFPAPPLRSSMTAGEATEYGRSRARSRSDSLLERQISLPTGACPSVKDTAPSLAAPTSSKKAGSCLQPSSVSHSDDGRHSTHKESLKNLNPSSSGKTRSTSSTMHPGPRSTDVVTALKKEASVPLTMPSKADTERTHHISVPEECASELGKKASASSGRDDSNSSTTSSSEESSSSSSSSSSSRAIIDKKKDPGNNSTPRSPQPKAGSPKERKPHAASTIGSRIGLDRGPGHGRIEVVVGSRTKARVWKPVATCSSNTGVDYGLLGNRRVEQWGDEDEADEQKDKGLHHKIDKSRPDRSKLVAGVVKREREKKRKMHVGRWDASLDRGKQKKVKKKADQTPSYDFQRIQASVQRMRHRGHRRDKSKNMKH